MAANQNVSYNELVREVAAELEMQSRDVKDVIDTFFDFTMEVVEEGLSLTVPKIIKIYPAAKGAQKARMGRNPATGEALEIAAQPASIVVRARILKDLKEAAPGPNSAEGKAMIREHNAKQKRKK